VTNHTKIELSKQALAAGEKVLREAEPDYFWGWPDGSFDGLVSNIVFEALKASGIDAQTLLDSRSGPCRSDETCQQERPL
jgi:hypothetical protein